MENESVPASRKTGLWVAISVLAAAAVAAGVLISRGQNDSTNTANVNTALTNRSNANVNAASNSNATTNSTVTENQNTNTPTSNVNVGTSTSGWKTYSYRYDRPKAFDYLDAMITFYYPPELFVESGIGIHITEAPIRGTYSQDSIQISHVGTVEGSSILEKCENQSEASDPALDTISSENLQVNGAPAVILNRQTPSTTTPLRTSIDGCILAINDHVFMISGPSDITLVKNYFRRIMETIVVTPTS